MMEYLRALVLGTSVIASVTDGDTVVTRSGERVRLTGFNTPELHHPHCAREAMLAKSATLRLRAFVRSGAVLHLQPGRCGYGRSCGRLTWQGEDVGDILVREGLAESFVCAGGRCPAPRDWCS